ncbi:hypothetical protein B0H10DRAFT_2197681 [Mycena sp. CBHHK59/15]|nr:hypothetical protein B0H10DRAFT_2197681 [Mycena sp. CBHHK59/15]
MFLLRCVAIRPSVAILPFRAAPHDTACCLNVLPKSWTIPLAWAHIDFPSNTKSHPKQGSLVFVLASDPAVPLLSSSRRFRAAHRFPSPLPSADNAPCHTHRIPSAPPRRMVSVHVFVMTV